MQDHTTKKTLLLMRHAAPILSDGPDFDRPLSVLGKNDAQAAGKILSSYKIDAVFCSPAARTRQTWECVQVGGASASQVVYQDNLYAASAREIAALVSGLPETASTVLVIGHNPALAEAARLLCRPNFRTGFLENGLARAAIVVLDFSDLWLNAEGNMNLVAHHLV